MTDSGLGGIPQSGGGSNPRPTSGTSPGAMEPTVMLPSMGPAGISLGYPSMMGMYGGMHPGMYSGFGMPNFGNMGPNGSVGFGHMGIFARPQITGMGAEEFVVPMYGNRLELDRERAFANIGHASANGRINGQMIGAGVGVAAGIGGAALIGAKAGATIGPWGALAGALIGGAVGLFAGGQIGSALTEHNAVMADFHDNGRLDNSNHGHFIRGH